MAHPIYKVQPKTQKVNYQRNDEFTSTQPINPYEDQQVIG
jgi:hypothetical protein